jgi:hypothetical protein
MVALRRGLDVRFDNFVGDEGDHPMIGAGDYVDDWAGERYHYTRGVWQRHGTHHCGFLG